jgi:hypothetical protein
MKIQSEFANSEEAADSERKIREDLIAEIEKYKDKRFLIFFFDVPDLRFWRISSRSHPGRMDRTMRVGRYHD